MSAFLVALSTWLHTLATVVFIGHYLFMSQVYLPIFEHQTQGDALRELLEKASNRLRPYFGSSLLIFLVTGIYLMMINEEYLGWGRFFGNAWSALIVIKHLILLVFFALAIYSERVIMGKISDKQPQAVRQFRLTLSMNTFLGMLIILLTTIAQAV
jgi:uncharacterized membrane protein